MTTIPDDDGQHHDAARPRPHGLLTTADLRRRYGDVWEITEHTDLPVWTAEHRSADGRHIRMLVGHSPGELAAKLETAGVVEP